MGMSRRGRRASPANDETMSKPRYAKNTVPAAERMLGTPYGTNEPPTTSQLAGSTAVAPTMTMTTSSSTLMMVSTRLAIADVLMPASMMSVHSSTMAAAAGESVVLPSGRRFSQIGGWPPNTAIRLAK